MILTQVRGNALIPTATGVHLIHTASRHTHLTSTNFDPTTYVHQNSPTRMHTHLTSVHSTTPPPPATHGVPPLVITMDDVDVLTFEES